MSNPPNLLECEPSELANYLLSERFEESTKATAAFLLGATAALPNAETLSADLLLSTTNDNDKIELEACNLGEALSEPSDISMIIPRGKFSCTLLARGMHCCNAKKDSFHVQAKHADQLIVFPKPEDIKKKNHATSDMILLTLKENVTFKAKEISTICFQLPQDSKFIGNVGIALNLTNVVRVGTSAAGWTFKSHTESSTSTTTGGMPCVRCYHGVHDGHLYPLVQGLLFFKPPLFLPRSNLHSISCGRGTSGSSRYVDMHIELNDGKSLEFTNIHRDELGVLKDYIHQVLIPAMNVDATQNNESKPNDERTENSESLDSKNATEDEEEDDSYNDHNRHRVCRSSRTAAKEALKATKAQMKTDEDSDEDDESWISQEQEDSDEDHDGVDHADINDTFSESETDDEEQVTSIMKKRRTF